MHYCIYVVTEEFPTDDVLEAKLRPFNYGDFYDKYHDEEGEIPEGIIRPPFTWDFWILGGRYGGAIKLKINHDDPEFRWGFYAKEPRAGRLYRSHFQESIREARFYGGSMIFNNREEDDYQYLGYSNGYICVDGCKIKDIIDYEKTILESWGFLGKDGTAYTRDYWNGTDLIKDESYEDKVRAALSDSLDCYVCCVDIHD